MEVKVFLHHRVPCLGLRATPNEYSCQLLHSQGDGNRLTARLFSRRFRILRETHSPAVELVSNWPSEALAAALRISGL